LDARDKPATLKMMSDLLGELIRAEVNRWPMKDVYMLFLLSINPDFDEDLLQDVLEVILHQ